MLTTSTFYCSLTIGGGYGSGGYGASSIPDPYSQPAYGGGGFSGGLGGGYPPAGGFGGGYY